MKKGPGENTAMGVLVSITLSCAIDLIIEKIRKWSASCPI